MYEIQIYIVRLEFIIDGIKSLGNYHIEIAATIVLDAKSQGRTYNNQIVHHSSHGAATQSRIIGAVRGPTLNYGRQLSLYFPYMLRVTMTRDLAYLQLSDLHREIKPICRTSDLQREIRPICRTSDLQGAGNLLSRT